VTPVKKRNSRAAATTEETFCDISFWVRPRLTEDYRQDCRSRLSPAKAAQRGVVTGLWPEKLDSLEVISRSQRTCFDQEKNGIAKTARGRLSDYPPIKPLYPLNP
jgi:hypothetical protein